MGSTGSSFGCRKEMNAASAVIEEDLEPQQAPLFLNMLLQVCQVFGGFPNYSSVSFDWIGRCTSLVFKNSIRAGTGVPLHNWNGFLLFLPFHHASFICYNLRLLCLLCSGYLMTIPNVKIMR